MDYESRQVKWWAFSLFIVYCGLVCYLLYTGNPLLYSHHELRAELVSEADSKLHTIPTEPVAGGSGKTGQATAQYRYSFSRTAVDPVGGTRGKGYEEFEKHEVQTGVKDWRPQHIASDATGFYVTGTEGWMVALNLDGKARWRYRFLKTPGDRGLLPPLVDEGHVYVVHPHGEVVSFDKRSGELKWLLPLKAELVANPFFWGNLIVLPTKGQTGVQLVLISRSNGEKLEISPRLDIKAGFQVSHSSDLDVIIATVDNKVIAIDPEPWGIAWTATLTEPIRGPAVILDSTIFVSTLGAKIVRLDGDRKGKVEWETELEKPAAAPPTYLPIMNRLSVVDTSGALMTLDVKTGKIYWRYGIDAKGEVADTWSSRLSAKFIEENGMDWLHKGWTIWTPCGGKRVCIYTPLKGALINRLQLSGEPLAMPLLIEKRLVFFTEVKEGEYVLSHQVEDGEVKRIRKEAAEKQKADAAE